jgi:hypothetical protein
MSWVKRIFDTPPHDAAVRHLERVDKETREVRHTLRNVQSSTQTLRSLILRMRDDGSFEERGQRQND